MPKLTRKQKERRAYYQENQANEQATWRRYATRTRDFDFEMYILILHKRSNSA